VHETFREKRFAMPTALAAPIPAAALDSAVSPAPVHVSTVTSADDGLYRSITGFAQHSAWLQSAMGFYTVAALGLLLLMAVYAWWSARARADRTAMAAVLWLGLGTVLSIGCGLALKQVFQENRPCQAIHVATVQACPGLADYSFPSDHTVFAVALAVGLWIADRKLGVVAVAIAAVEGFSRVYLGQHYPHDVLAGASVSTVILLVGWNFAQRPLTSLVATLETTPLRPLLIGAPIPVPAGDGTDPARTAQATFGRDRR
jgi:membrane-associated phospholipid phosphatase